MLIAAWLFRRGRTRGGVLALGVAFAGVIVPLVLPFPHELIITQLDVGQGDAAVIRTPSDRIVLIDTGGELEHGDAQGPSSAERAGARIVLGYLRRAGIRHVDLMLLTHPHGDHKSLYSHHVPVIRLPREMRAAKTAPKSDRQRVAWAYCRVSTTKDEQELSLEEQIAWATSYARQNQLRLRIFSEKASAKTIVQRPIIVSMLQELREGAQDTRPAVIIATSFDRLARDVFDSFTLFGTLREAAVEVFVRDGGPMKMQSPVDAAILFGRAFGGHAENQARSDRMKASWERRRREGKPTSNKMPYGIQLLNERDTPAPETSVWVRRAFEWYADGIGMLTIARRLENAPTHRVLTSKIGSDGQRIARERPTLWEPNRVRKLLEQRRYRGLLVSEEVFDKVQALMASKPRYSNVRKSEYPLSGSMQCLNCGRNLHGHATGGSTRRLANGELRRYRNVVRYYSCNVCRYMLNAERTEAQFFDKLNKLSASKTLLESWVASEKVSSTTELTNELQALQKAIEPKRLEAARSRVWELAMANKSLPTGELDRQLGRMAKDEQVSRDRIEEIMVLLSTASTRQRTIDCARSLLSDFRELFDAGSYDEKREICLAISEALGGITTTADGIQWVRETKVKPPSKRRESGRAIAPR